MNGYSGRTAVVCKDAMGGDCFERGFSKNELKRIWRNYWGGRSEFHTTLTILRGWSIGRYLFFCFSISLLNFASISANKSCFFFAISA